MSEVSDRFSAIFRDEHRAVRDALLDLIEAFRGQDGARAKELLERIAALSGPHFRYEEEVMYPGLVQIFGQKYVDTLFKEHDGAIRSAERLVELSANQRWSEAEIEEATELARGILPHVSDCDGLSLMVERLPTSEVDAILEARDRSLADGVDLLRWAREIRGTSGNAPAAA